jgi:hypothetical protein
MDIFPKFKFKNDSYTRRRGAPAMLLIICGFCNKDLIVYQKDGPGPLLRCYLDRIHYPDEIRNRQFLSNKNEIPKLECNLCKTLVGVPFIYEKESRLAYHMKTGNFSTKKLYQGKKLKEPTKS